MKVLMMVWLLCAVWCGCGAKRIPPHAEYRKAIDKWFNFIKKTTEKHTTVRAGSEQKCDAVGKKKEM